jgi:hypothetical protein
LPALLLATRLRVSAVSVLLRLTAEANYIFFAFFLAFLAICRPSANVDAGVTPIEEH